MAAPLFDGPGLSRRELTVPRDRVMLLRYVLEAYDGLASLHGDDEGTITLLTPVERADELDALLAELTVELGLAPPGA
ncbi:MAG: DUF4911 domain-containing protein [Sandaracinaceae bacterium]